MSNKLLQTATLIFFFSILATYVYYKSDKKTYNTSSIASSETSSFIHAIDTNIPEKFEPDIIAPSTKSAPILSPRDLDSLIPPPIEDPDPTIMHSSKSGPIDFDIPLLEESTQDKRARLRLERALKRAEKRARRKWKKRKNRGEPEIIPSTKSAGIFDKSDFISMQ